MYKGTVMETTGRSAVVLTPDGQFQRVKTRGHAAVGEEITWSDAELVTGRAGVSLWQRRWMTSGISAAALLILFVALWSFRTPPVVAYVSMDINPSVEFGLDARERVRELRAVNKDAVPIISGVDYKGEPVDKVMTILAQKLAVSHILQAQGSEIVIASVRIRTVDRQWEMQVTEKIKMAIRQAAAGDSQAAAVPGLDIETVYLPVEVREEAKSNGISSGKMAFWLAAENGGHNVPLTELKKDSVKQIADSWGGLKKVMEDGQARKDDQPLKDDKEIWKRLLAEQKEKSKQSKKNEDENRSSAVPSPDNPKSSKAPESRPRNGNDDGHRDDDHGGGGKDPQISDKPNGNAQNRDANKKNGENGNKQKQQREDHRGQDQQQSGKPNKDDKQGQHRDTQSKPKDDRNSDQNGDGNRNHNDDRKQGYSGRDGQRSGGEGGKAGGNRQHQGQNQDDGRKQSQNRGSDSHRD